MKKLILAAAPIAMLAACSGGGDADADGDGEVSADEAAEVAEDVNVRPGMWETTFEITELDIPNAPPEMQSMLGAMRQQMGQGMSDTSCLTQEEADNMQESMFNDDDDCTVSDFNMSGGNMRVVATCQEGDGPAMTMTMDGTYTETTNDMTVTAEGEIPELGPMRFSGNMTRRHVSDDCGAEG